MKVRSEDILKPGAVLVTELIDWDKPENRRLLAQTRLEQRKLRRRLRFNQDYYDNLRKVITI